MKNLKLSNEELEEIAYDDLAYLILQDSKKKIKIQDLFRKIIKLKKLGESEFENRIADFFEIISTDKRFILLEQGYCDLRINQSHKIVIEKDDDDLSEDLDLIKEDIIEEEIEEDNELYSDELTADDDEGEDEYKDLTLISEDEEELDDML